MSTQTIDPAEQDTGPAIGDQQDAFALLSHLASAYAGLPAAYATVHTALTLTQVGLQLDSPAGFEAWRVALDIDAEAVELRSTQGGTWLQVDTELGGVELHLTGFGVSLMGDLPPAPWETYRQGQLAEQRHQFFDIDPDLAPRWAGVDFGVTA